MLYHCGISGDISDEVSWFFSPLSLSRFCQPDRQKQFLTNLLSKKYALIKVFEENQQFAVWSFRNQIQFFYQLW